MTFSIVRRAGGRSRRGRLTTLLMALLASLVLGVVLLPAGPAVGGEADWPTLTIKVLDHNGQAPCDDCTFNVSVYQDTYEGTGRWVDRERYGMNAMWFGIQDGVASGKVPPGTYFLWTYFYDAPTETGSSRLDYLIEVDVVVEDDTEVTLDARDAMLMARPEVPDSEVQVRSRVLSFCHRQVVSGFYACDVSLDSSGNEYAGKWRTPKDVYMTPFPASQLQGTYVVDRWILAEPQPLEPVPNQIDPRDTPRNYSPTPEHMYHVSLLYDQGVSVADLSERTLTADRFTEVPVSYHADKPGTLIRYVERVEAAYGGVVPEPQVFFEPGEVTHHYLADDRLAWALADALYYEPVPDAESESEYHRKLLMTGWDAFPLDEAGTRRKTEHHFSAPHRHGMVDANPRFWEVARNNGFAIETLWPSPRINALMARGGFEGSEFVVPFSHAWNSGVQQRGNIMGTAAFDTSWRMWNADTGIELVNGDTTDSLPVFQGLVPSQATYRLEQTDAYPEWMAPYFLTKPTATTVWTFESERSDAEIAPEYKCWPWEGTVCQIQPLMQLRYELGLDTNNRAPAGQKYTFAIEAWHHVEAVDTAEVKGFSVQASFDDGETWEYLQVRASPGRSADQEGMFRVEITHPELADTNGFVSLRVHAVDANGGTIDQYLERAYILKCGASEAWCGEAAQAPVEGSVTTAAAGAGVRVDGVTSQFVEFEVPEGVDNAGANVVAAYPQAANIDLYLQRQGADGTWGPDLASGTSGELDGERMGTGPLVPGVYRIEVHNRAGLPGNQVAVTATFYNSKGERGT